MNHLHSITLAATLVVGLCGGALAQQAPADQAAGSQAVANPAITSQAMANPGAAPAAKPVPAPGDRNCIRDTGSLIKPPPGHCLSVPGRSYSQQDLRSTGQIDNARALQQLDPSISIGGH